MKGESIIVTRIKEYLEKIFRQRKYFVVIYGSFANGMYKVGSDADFCVITENFSTEELAALKQFVLALHQQNKLKIDNEVPFENKLMATYQEAEDAAYLAGFAIRDGAITIPPIIKSKEFLESKAVKLRLILNALTSPHIMIGNDSETYDRLRNTSEMNMFLMAAFLSQSANAGQKQMFQKLLLGPAGEEGEMYLGYKRYPLVKKYLEGWLRKQGDHLPKSARESEWNKLLREVEKRSTAT